MYGAGIETGEYEDPNLPDSRVGACGFPVAYLEVSEDIYPTVVEWWGCEEALFREVSHFLGHSWGA